MIIRFLKENYLKIILLNGLIVAIIKFLNLSLPTSPINLITAFFSPFFLYQFIKSKKSLTKTFISFFLIYQIFKLVIFQYFNLTDIFNIFHEILAYTIFSYCFYLGQTNKIKQLLIIRNFFYFFLIVFVIQYFFKDKLPEAFTEIPNLFNKVGIEKYTRLIDEKYLYRPNGLIGNPITFGFLLNILLVLELTFISILKTKTKSLIIITLILFMIFLLFSRANILLAIIIISISFIKRLSGIKIILISLVFLVSVFFINNFLYSSFVEYKYASDRLTNQDIYAQKSTDEHIIDYISAYNLFLKNPFFGVSSKKIIEDSIITDGAIPILILRYGLLGSLFMFMMYFSFLKICWKKSKNNDIFQPLFIFILLLIPYSIINSAILNKAVYLIIFSFFGIIANLNFKILKQ